MTLYKDEHEVEFDPEDCLGLQHGCSLRQCTLAYRELECQALVCLQGCKVTLLQRTDLSTCPYMRQSISAAAENKPLREDAPCLRMTDALAQELLRWSWPPLGRAEAALSLESATPVPRTLCERVFLVCSRGLAKIAALLHLGPAQRRQGLKEQVEVEGPLPMRPNV